MNEILPKTKNLLKIWYNTTEIQFIGRVFMFVNRNSSGPVVAAPSHSSLNLNGNVCVVF